MKDIYMNLCDILEIGDRYPTVIMGVLNLSPESFYKGSIYTDDKALKNIILEMIDNGAKILDLGARSTAPWSEKITIEEEINRLSSAMKLVCKIIPENIILSIDTQFSKVAKVAYDISIEYQKKIIINDVSCLKTDLTLQDFLIKYDLPVILMASEKVPGDLCTIKEITEEFEKTVEQLKLKGYNENNIILDPGIGKWVEEKVYTYDLKIINDLPKLRDLNKPILVAISRKSFIGTTLDIPDPKDRLDGTLSSTVIAVYNGAHIVRTHDVDNQLFEMVKIAEKIRES
ncbi:MAG: dihydropteroate synthase [Promethearchaeota archaeon]|jgi:dihydropteroate synthase